MALFILLSASSCSESGVGNESTMSFTGLIMQDVKMVTAEQTKLYPRSKCLFQSEP